MDLTRIITNDILVCVVERGSEVYIPSGNFKLHEDDIISFVSTRRNAISFLRDVGFNTNQVTDTLIIGGGTDAYYLADQLIKRGVSVKIIESNLERCDELSILLPKAIIINGDGTDQELLKEEGIEKTESFVPLTGIDEENILLTLYARQISKAKVITKLNRANFNSVVNTLDLGSIIYPQFVTSEAIFAYVRAKKNSIGSNIETLYHLFDSRVEAIEFSVRDDSKVIGTSLADMTLKQGILVACINRNGKVIIPSGQDEIMPGDNVIIVTKHSGFGDINDILQ
jgi:trk system potassium uptake protein TrkA